MLMGVIISRISQPFLKLSGILEDLSIGVDKSDIC